LQDISWFSINFQKILRFSLPGFTIIFKKIHGFSLIGFAFIFKKYSVPVYSVLTLFSKNIRLDFNRLGDILKKYSVGFYSVSDFFEKIFGFWIIGFTFFLKKYSVSDIRLCNRIFLKYSVFQQPNKKSPTE